MILKKLTPKKRWQKIVVSISLILAIFIALIIFFISPIAKYIIEKYDTKYLGREIKIDWAYVNPFTGYIYLNDVKIYEAKSDTIFLKANGLSADFAMIKLFSKTYEISSITINKPKGSIIRNDNTFNFTDIIEKFSTKDSSKIKKEPTHFNILNCKIKDGTFYFSTPSTPINYSFIKVNFDSEGKYWDRDTINGNLSLQSGIGPGDIKLNFGLNLKTLDYYFATVVTNFNMGVTKQYLKDLTSYGNVSGFIDADIKAKGNFKNKEYIDGHGRFSISDFHFGKDSLNDYVSYKKLSLGIIQLSPANKIYLFDSVRLQEPYFKYEKYDRLDNIQNMFGKNGSKVQAIKNDPEKFNLIVTISQYIQTIFQNFFKSNYKINSLAIVDGNIKFNDYSSIEKFAVSLNPFNIKSDSIDKKNKMVNVYLNSGIKPYGNINVSLSIDPKTNKDFDLKYKLQQIPISIFNPYIVSLTSFPLDRGRIELFGNWKVNNNMINSKNHLLIIDPRISKRVVRKDIKWLPLKVLMFFVRERSNVIDYEIPITGYIKDPNFHYKDAIIDALKNIIIKPITSPYRYEVKELEKEIEKSISLVWYARQSKLTKTHYNFLKKISKFLKENPQSNIVVNPMTYDDKEKESIMFFEAKKKYYFSCNLKNLKYMTEDDSLAIEKMSNKDSLFVKYLDENNSENMIFTVQEKCYNLIGDDLIKNEFSKLIRLRNEAFMNYFVEKKTNNQIKIFNSQNKIPFNGFSYFKINYEGDIPESLSAAYQQIQEFNEEAPRDKYNKFRKKIN